MHFYDIWVAMYIDIVPNRNSPPAILLRESYRENGKVKKRTLSNLSNLPLKVIDILRRSLKNENLIAPNESFEIIEDGSPAHGHVEAVLTAMRRLKFPELISSKKSRQRDIVVAIIAARILKPQSKLATTLWWNDTTLPKTLGISDVDEDDLYEAMDWLLQRQDSIEKKLANRHLENNATALYDLSSSYFEGKTCPLAARGHNRDRKKGKLQVNYGLLTNWQGIPVAVSVYKGNTGDPKTLLPQVNKLQNDFGIDQFVIVGDRGMLTQKKIEALRDFDDIDWISALRPEAIKKLINCGSVQMGFFDERNLFELEHPDFPGERLVACRNEDLAYKRSIKREKLLAATAKELDRVIQIVRRGRLRGKIEIEDRVCKVLKKYKIKKHYIIEMREDGFKCKIDKKKLIDEITAKSKGDNKLIQKRLEISRRHIKSISKQLIKVRRMINRGQLYGQDKIGVRVGKVVNKYKVSKHFKLHIQDNDFNYEINKDKVKEEANLDGIYIIRTSLSANRMDADTTVRSYKQLSKVEIAFRSFKTIDLMVRPIYHHLEQRVRAHIFQCMLSYYVQWHMFEAWRPLLYADEEQEVKSSRDPVDPAVRSDSAMQKVHTKHLEDGSHVYSFRALLDHLGAIVLATCRCTTGENKLSTFTMTTKCNPKQRKAFDLLQKIKL
jgi:transposase